MDDTTGSGPSRTELSLLAELERGGPGDIPDLAIRTLSSTSSARERLRGLLTHGLVSDIGDGRYAADVGAIERARATNRRG